MLDPILAPLITSGFILGGGIAFRYLSMGISSVCSFVYDYGWCYTTVTRSDDIVTLMALIRMVSAANKKKDTIAVSIATETQGAKRTYFISKSSWIKIHPTLYLKTLVSLDNMLVGIKVATRKENREEFWRILKSSDQILGKTVDVP